MKDLKALIQYLLIQIKKLYKNYNGIGVKY